MRDLAEATITSAPLDGGGTLVTVDGELDIATVEPLRDELARTLDAGARRVVVDMRGVSFLDSIAVATLVRAAGRVPGRFAVAIEPGSYVRMIFEIAGLIRGLGVFESLDDALAHVAGAS